jgi:hypothetical protein
MNPLLLTPTDTLFFRDGRPMDGALAGHGAAWPLPTVTNAALHAALHDASRSSLLTGSAHRHDHMRGTTRHLTDARAFGSLTTAGPFPVSPAGEWTFPRPLDLTGGTLTPSLFPQIATGASSLPTPLKATLVSNQPPTKHSPAKAWLSAADYTTYLTGDPKAQTQIPSAAYDDDEIYLAESTIGIGIDASTGTTGQGEAQGKIYSAHSLRLRPDWRLGLLASTDEKQPDGTRRDLISQDLYARGKGHLILGGQQRVCSVESANAATPPLPRGRTAGFEKSPAGKYLVKWVLLSPAIFPAITAGISKRGTERKAHPGGWLPTWIDPESGKVLLETIDEAERDRRRKLNYNGQGYTSTPNIAAHLVAARTDKPLPITGWANGDASLGEDSQSGAKSTHLAVPAGSVYYFACESEAAAAQLAAALNWHGSDANPTTIRNRRSTLLGEKGFGLGVCGTWTPHPTS